MASTMLVVVIFLAVLQGFRASAHKQYLAYQKYGQRTGLDTNQALVPDINQDGEISNLDINKWSGRLTPDEKQVFLQGVDTIIRTASKLLRLIERTIKSKSGVPHGSIPRWF